jgi:phosphoglycerate dehydrogenase-like enzyme
MTSDRSPSRCSPLRVHVQESRNSIDGFQVTRERFLRGLALSPDLAARIDATFGADRSELDRGLADAEVLLAGNFEADDLRRRAPVLRWVQSIFAGVETLLAAIPSDVALTNASGVHAPKAAEFAVCSLLMLNSAIPQMIAHQRSRQWRPIFTPTVAGKTVVVLGTGCLGTAVAEAAARFGVRTVGVSRSGRPTAAFSVVHEVTRLTTVLPEADFLVVTLPNTPATRKIIGRREFAALKRGAGFVSIGRGQVVDQSALVEALQSGHLGSAVLDVFEVEPLPQDSPLWNLDNVVVCAHCGVDDLDAYVPRALDLFLRNVSRYLSGEELLNRIQPELGY